MGRWSCTGTLRWCLAITAAQPRSSRGSPRSFNTIQAFLREHIGRMAAARDRAMGRIPAVIHSGTGGRGQEREAGRHGPASRKLLVTASEEQVLSLMRQVPSFCSTPFGLQVRTAFDSRVLQSGIVLPLKVHRDETTGRILNLELKWVEEGSRVKLCVPLVYNGADVCPGLQKGGCFNKIKTSIGCLCPVDEVPQAILVDLTNLDIGDRVLLKDVSLPSSVELVNEDKSVKLCEIVISRPDESKRKIL